jgi:branched-chain amino acid aminotransferase
MLVWLNGKFIEHDKAAVSILDAGFQHGVGLFETMLARNGRVFRPHKHIERLIGSAKTLLLTERLRSDPLADAVQLTVEKNNLEDARVRLTVTGGNLNLLTASPEDRPDPTLLIVAQPPTQYPDKFFQHGVLVVAAEGRENPFHPMAGHKTVNYWPRIRALQMEAGRRGAAEVLWFTVTNHLASGCVSNAFLVKDGELITPIARGEEQQGMAPSCVLPGITRAAILELAAEEGIAIHRQMIDVRTLLEADEAFLTNSSWGVLPVVGVEDSTIGDGRVGDVTLQLREAWRGLVERETAAAISG